MSKQLLIETAHVSAIAQDLGGDTVFVTFNAMGILRNGLEFWADRFFLKRGLSALGVMTARPNWFPAADMAQVLPHLKAQIAGRRVVTYGHSQGAYGALKFARALGARVTLAFCPQWSIDPGDVAAFDPRYAVFFDHQLDNGRRVENDDLGEHSFVFFDSREHADAQHARRLAALRGVRLVTAPFSMHDTIRLITEGGAADELIGSCTQATPDAALLRRVVRSCRERSPTYHKHALSQLLQRLHFSRCGSTLFFGRALRRQTELDDFHEVLAARARCDASAEQQALARLEDRHFDNIDLIFLWTLCNRLRFFEMERRVAQQIFMRYADKTPACLHAVTTLIRGRQLDAAIAELSRMVQHADAFDYIGAFVDLAVRLQRPDLIENLLVDTTPAAAEIPIRLRLVECHRRAADRAAAFRSLLRLASLCQQHPDYLAVIATHLLGIGEARYALELRERLQRCNTGDIDTTLDVMEARIAVGSARNASELDALTGKVLNAGQWERVSVLQERLGRTRRAFHALRQGLRCADAPQSLRLREVYLLMVTRRRRRACRALLTMLAAPPKDAGVLRGATELSLHLKRTDLALQFATLLWRQAPQVPDIVILHAHCQRLAGEPAAARQQLTQLFDREQRYPSFADYQWVALMQELFDAGMMDLAISAAEEVLAREPANRQAQSLLAKLALLRRHGGCVASNSIQPVAARTHSLRQRVLAWAQQWRCST